MSGSLRTITMVDFSIPMKKTLILILLFAGVLISKADDSNWKMHPIFDEEVTHVVDTPDYVYFTSKNKKEGSTTPTFSSLFRYDKKGEELISLSTSNILNSTSVRDLIYNPTKGYMAVLYKDYTLDFIYNNGEVVSMPFYALSDITYDKTVNSMAIDPEQDRLYLATDFGYVAINDKKNEIAESRIYGEPLMGFCRMGDKYLALKGDELVQVSTDSPRLSLDQYEIVGTFEDARALHPINADLCLLVIGEKNPRQVIKISKEGNKYNFGEEYSGALYNFENTTGGLMFTGDLTIFLYDNKGEKKELNRPEGYQNSALVTSDLSNIWVGRRRNGLANIKWNGSQWSLLKLWMQPNAPATFATTSFANHPTYGFLMLDYGYTQTTMSLNSDSPLQLSGYRQGRWTNYAPAYTNTGKTNIMTASNGMAIDPDNNKYVYISSYHEGILRLNLSDPQDIVHMNIDKGTGSSQNGTTLGPTQQVGAGWWNISAPYFDKQGNLWMNYANYNEQANPRLHFYVWSAADRRATSSQSNMILPKELVVDLDFPVSNTAHSLPLLKTGNGLIVYANSTYDEKMALIDTNGTPLDASDDKAYPFNSFTDSDGNNVEVRYIKYFYEDPNTGYVWVCHSNGVFYFVPSQIKQGNYQIYRIKVARNDGTNLADYLLDGVSVNHIAVDSEGRKWFGTAGGGVIATTSDGREILEEFTMENSPLPDDVIYGIGYNSDTNSLMFSTAQGYAEYSLPVSSYSSVKEDIRAYPNPVRPNYSGYVTITDIPQGSFVKITDSAGNLVKELGIMSGFEMLWDISDSNFNRVKSGVYHIMVSPGDEISKYSTVGKILVVS